jgi:hypothetical protein
LAVGLWTRTGGSRGSRGGTALIGVYGLGAILSALFPTDSVTGAPDITTMSTAGIVHVAVALVSFPSAVIGMVVLTRTFRHDPRWQPIWQWSLVLSLTPLVGLFLPGMGLSQRFLVGAIAGWIVLVALRLRRLGRSSRS